MTHHLLLSITIQMMSSIRNLVKGKEREEPLRVKVKVRLSPSEVDPPLRVDPSGTEERYFTLQYKFRFKGASLRRRRCAPIPLFLCPSCAQPLSPSVPLTHAHAGNIYVKTMNHL